MASYPEYPQTQDEAPLTDADPRRRRALLALLALGIVLVVVAIWVGYRFRGEYLALCLGAGWLGVIYTALAAWELRQGPAGADDAGAPPALTLLLAGATGLALTLVGVTLAWQWWDTYLGWLRGEPGPAGWRTWVSLLLAFAGLAVMFVGLQVARGQERARPLLRRLLYGYNAFLTGLLVLAILAVINVLAYAKLPDPINFTASTMYDLSSRSRSVLQGIAKPIKVYVIVSRGTLEDVELQTLLDRCREVNNRIGVEYLDPRSDPQPVRELAKRYSITGLEGVLIVSGAAPDESHQFIGLDDLYTTDFSTRGSRDQKFKGEDAVISAFAALEEGKSKPVIYFTQGHGEFDINDSGTARPGQGAGILRGRLEKRNYDVKPLTFSPADPKVPADATVVVIARPAMPFTAGEVKALRDYVKGTGPKKGKLLVLLDLTAGADGTPVRTGLEAFLAEFNVRVGNERVLSFQDLTGDPADVLAAFNPRVADRNKVAALFEGRAFQLRDVRPVEPAAEEAPGRPAGGFSAEPLLLALAQYGLWLEPNLTADPMALATALRRDREALVARLSQRDIPIGVAVTEPASSADPHAFMRPPAEGTPRLIVYGQAAMASNEFIEKGRGFYYEIIANSLDWLRGRPQSIGIEPKARSVFTLEPDANVGRIVLLPTGLMILGVIGLGAGVWAVRRQ